MKSKLEIENNSKLRLFCSVQHGRNPFEFQWKYNEQVLLNNETGIIDHGEDWSSFKIDNVLSNHAGNYSCTVINQFGTDTQFLKLLVKGL